MNEYIHESLPENQSHLAKELAGARALQRISTKLIQENRPHVLYEMILDAALELMGSDAASMQILNPKEKALELLGYRNFHKKSAQYWHRVDINTGCACGKALAENHRIVIPDVEVCAFISHPDDLEAYRCSGLRAVQSTPLISRTGTPLGMISTHWKNVHQPSEIELGLFDVLARQAADLIERSQKENILTSLNESLEQSILERTADLQKSQKLIQATLDSSREMIQVFQAIRNEQGKIVDFIWILNNHTSEQIYGNVIGKSLLQHNPGVVKEGIFDRFVEVTETGISQQYECHYVHEQFDGWFHQSVVKLDDGVATSTANITERQKKEHELVKNLTLLQQSEDVATLGSWDYDLSSHQLSWSNGMYRLFNLRPGTSVNLEIYLDFVSERCLAATKKLIQFIKTGQGNYETTLEMRFPTGLRYIHLKAASILDEQGKRSRVLGVDMDVTAAKKAEEKIQLMESEQQRQIFIASLDVLEEERRRISESLHNGLGQLLYGIKISLSHLETSTAIHHPKEFEKMKKYTEDLLSKAIKDTRKISHELMPTVLQDFGLKTAINDICSQFRNDVHFTCHLEELDSRVDKHLQLAIYRITQELMLNVVKHAQAKEAFLHISTDADKILLYVEDKGQGMQASAYGKGIGLQSIKNNIDLLKGRVEIRSIPGKGTKIRISIPYYMNGHQTT